MKTSIQTSNLLLSTLILLLLTSFSANSQTTYIDNGSSSTYTLNSGDSLFINSGTYTGTINTWNAGSKITVGQNATFKPSSFSDNKAKVIVLGIAVLPTLNTGAGFDLKNYGTITVNGDAAMNGGAQSWTNNFGASMIFKGNMAINYNGSTFTNNGTVTAKSDFYLYSSSTIINTNNFTAEGNFKSSQGIINNGGKFYSIKGITFGGSTAYTNTCSTISDNGIMIDNSAAVIYNNGFMWATNASKNSFITNSGTIINGAQAKMKSVAFTNYATISGRGSLYFTGVTTGSGTFGVTGTTTDTIKVYDVTRSNPSTIFDNQWGTIRPNVIYSVIAAPDTSAIAFASCSSQFVSSSSTIALLPITWNYFNASLINEIPVLDWSAEHDPGTFYEVQRSYDNANFITIATIAAEANKTIYQYQDKKADNNKSVIYYRIKGVEPTGEQKFTQVKIIKITNSKTSSIQVSPNPFTSQFTINYQTTTKERIVIKIYNGMGQLNASKTFNVANGNNQIAITEAALFSRGIYVVEISNSTSIISTQKIVKQ